MTDFFKARFYIASWSEGSSWWQLGASLLILSEQGVEVLVIRPCYRSRFEDKQILIIGFGVLGKIIAARDHNVVVDDHHLVVHEIVLVARTIRRASRRFLLIRSQ